MNQVARVFVVLNMLLAAGFLFAAATFLALNNDYKTKYEAEQQARQDEVQQKDNEIQRLSGLNRDLQTQNNALTQARDNLDGRVQELTTSNANLTQQNATKDTQIADLTRNMDSMRQTVDTHQSNLMATVNENTALSKQAREARDEARAARDDLAKLQGVERDLRNNIAGLERTIQSQGEDIKQKDLKITYASGKGIDFENLTLMQPVSGSVTNADNVRKFLLMNVGTSAGVKRGYVFDIVRGGNYIGRCRVDEVHTNMATATITLLNDGRQVMSGDRVTNTLN